MRSLSHLLSDFFNPVYGYRAVQKRGLTIVYWEFRAEIWTKSCPLFWWRTHHQTTHFVGSLVSCCCSVAFMVNSDGVWVRGTGRRMMLQQGEWACPRWELLGTCLCPDTRSLMNRGDWSCVPATGERVSSMCLGSNHHGKKRELLLWTSGSGEALLVKWQISAVKS